MNNKQVTGFQKVLLTLNCVAVLALLVCYLAPFINPASFWLPAFFSMGYIPVIFVNAFFLVFWMIRLKAFALISGIGILFGIGLMLHNVGFHKQRYETTKPSEQSIRVMTYNVYDFLNEAVDIKENTNDAVLKLIQQQQQQPDIISMQEFFTHNQDGYVMVDSIKKVLNSNHYWFKAFKITPYDTTGMAIFSKYPIVNQDTIAESNGIKTEGMFVDINKDGKILRVYNVHLHSTNFDREENAYLANLPADKRPSLHQSRNIMSKLKRAFITRGEQVIAVKQQMDKCPYPYIVAGDFNDTPLSFSVNYMSRGLKNAFREKGSGLGVTFFGEWPGFQLDYIMVSPQFDVLNYKILRERLSDHYPVISDIQFK